MCSTSIIVGTSIAAECGTGSGPECALGRGPSYRVRNSRARRRLRGRPARRPGDLGCRLPGGRALEGGVPVGEDAAVGRRRPVAPGGPVDGDADDRGVESRPRRDGAMVNAVAQSVDLAAEVARSMPFPSGEAAMPTTGDGWAEPEM